MNPPRIQLVSTDFDGTLYADLDDPPVPEDLQALIAGLQQRGAKWVINTGRDRASLMQTLDRLQLAVQPDYLVLVEREIHERRGGDYVGVEEWNRDCEAAHAGLFARLLPRLPRIIRGVKERFEVMVFEDDFSPFCLVAQSPEEAAGASQYLEEVCAGIPGLTQVRNHTSVRLAHADYNKGTALSELARRVGITADRVFAAGDHYNDLPMLSSRHARFLASPANGIPEVHELVRRQGGYVSPLGEGRGVADSLRYFLGE